MKILITGSSGYVGNFLAEHLAWLGHAVIACDLRPPPRPAASRNISFRRLDVTDALGILEVFLSEKPDCVIHLAYLMEPQHDAAFEERVDYGGSMNIFEAANACPTVRQLLTFSSTSAYGAHADNPDFISETAPLRPNDYVYGIHKRRVEEAWLAADRRDDLKIVIFRMCTAVGPSYFKPGGLVSGLAKSPVMPLFGGMDTKTQWIHEDDVKVLTALVLRDVEITGIFNLVPEDYTRSRVMAQALGKRCLPVPLRLFRFAVSVLWFLRLSKAAPSMVRLATYGIVASPKKLRDRYQYRFRFGSLGAFLDAVSKRRQNGTL